MIPPWRIFDVDVVRLHRLSPAFLRVTFGGGDLNLFADNGFDQRIKVALPLPGSGVTHLPRVPDLYSAWRALPEHKRNPIRTYTVRAVRPEVSEVDIDFVMHPGGDGPAITWARSARLGDKLALLGPDARFDGPHGGLDFQPPAAARTVLLGGDETAVPAISSIVERLPENVTGAAVLEVPTGDDFLPVSTRSRVELVWRARAGAPPGTLLVPAVIAAADRLLPQGNRTDVEDDPDVDTQTLWELPDEPAPGAQAYTWLAGEAGVIKTLRRHLLGELGVDRRSIALMGYWRLGRAEPNA